MDHIVWYVAGDTDNMLWETKADAEKWAREIFPHLDEDARYARVRFRHVYTYEEPKG